MMNIPFDVSFHFDNNLHDIPNAADDMRHAIEFLQAELIKHDDNVREQIYCLGLIGSYARMLHDLTVARQALNTAIELSSLMGDDRLILVNRIRLAQVYQWEQRYDLSEALFEAVLNQCRNTPTLESYLDFAYQHIGKCRFDQAQYEAAKNYFEQALELRKRKGDQSLIDSTQFALNIVQQRINGIQSTR